MNIFRGNKVYTAFIVYSLLVFLAEITLGNEHFVFPLWNFTSVSSWQWSIPVHLTGFVILLLSHLILKNKNILFKMLPALFYFILMELLNFHYFHFFDYGNELLSVQSAFVLVILLYAVLVFIVLFFLDFFSLKFGKVSQD